MGNNRRLLKTYIYRKGKYVSSMTLIVLTVALPWSWRIVKGAVTEVVDFPAYSLEFGVFGANLKTPTCCYR